MSSFRNFISRGSVLGLLLVTVISLGSVGSVSAASSSQVREAQTIAKKFGMPVGTVDGVYGPQTGRGLCAFRSISGLPVSRATVDTALLAKLRSYNSRYSALTRIPAPTLAGKSTYLVANKTCQAMVYAQNGHYRAVLPISTGMSGHGTPSGTFTIGATDRGWHCSTIYPESCRKQSTGRFQYISNVGNMYNRRHVAGAVYVHGSTSVPTYPASHGCIRVTVAQSDWMYDNVDASIPIRVTGAY